MVLPPEPFPFNILQNKNETIRPSYSVKFQPNKKQNIRVFLEHSVLPIISSVFGSVFPNMFLVLSITSTVTVESIIGLLLVR